MCKVKNIVFINLIHRKGIVYLWTYVNDGDDNVRIKKK